MLRAYSIPTIPHACRCWRGRSSRRRCTRSRPTRLSHAETLRLSRQRGFSTSARRHRVDCCTADRSALRPAVRPVGPRPAARVPRAVQGSRKVGRRRLRGVFLPTLRQRPRPLGDRRRGRSGHESRDVPCPSRRAPARSRDGAVLREAKRADGRPLRDDPRGSDRSGITASAPGDCRPVCWSGHGYDCRKTRSRRQPAFFYGIILCGQTHPRPKRLEEATTLRQVGPPLLIVPARRRGRPRRGRRPGIPLVQRILARPHLPQGIRKHLARDRRGRGRGGGPTDGAAPHTVRRYRQELLHQASPSASPGSRRASCPSAPPSPPRVRPAISR